MELLMGSYRDSRLPLLGLEGELPGEPPASQEIP